MQYPGLDSYRRNRESHSHKQRLINRPSKHPAGENQRTKGRANPPMATAIDG
ncbi:MAG: hypothetical protein R2568_10100 [Candidatus Scalindua sp.]|nr:hypothetical protein [Candidatus Scalindua sp.]MDV5167081.1 hypothetical protein [Candidatus Scalindua sp.]